MTALKACQVVTPHADIRQEKFDTSVFAADLGELLAGAAPLRRKEGTPFFPLHLGWMQVAGQVQV